MEAETAKGWFSDAAATFGDRVAGAREAAGMTPEDLSRRLGVKLRTVIAWEDDASEPRANKLQMMAGMLNVSLMWLLTGKGDGIEGPVGAATPQIAEAGAILLELGQMRGEIAALGDRMAVLQKQLRGVLRVQTVAAE